MFSLFLLAFGCHPTPNASSEGSTTIPRRVLRVGTSGDYAPFSIWPVGDPAPRGFSVSVAQAYARDANAELVWIRFRWPELATDLAADSFDLALSGVTVRPDRSTQGRFGLPMTSSGAIVLVPAASSFTSAAHLDRASTHIAVNAGGHLERVTRRLLPSARIEAVADNNQVLGRLLDGQVDAIVSDTLEAPHWQQAAARPLRMIGPLTRDRKAAWFPPENEEEAFRFNRWLIRAESTGLLDRLRRAHGLPIRPTALPLAALLSSLDERLTLMKAVAETKYILAVEIENPTREEIVLDAALHSIQNATDLFPDRSPDLIAVRRLFRAQIEAAKWIQNQHIGQLRSEQKTTRTSDRFAARAKLDKEIRPALLYLGNRISMLVIACAAEPPKTLVYDDVVRALEDHDLPQPYLRELYEALSELVKRGKNTEPAHPPSPARTNRAPNG